MRLSPQLRQVLSRYGADCQPTQCRALGSAGGFSGAAFWRLRAPRGLLILRRWPTEHPSPDRLRFIHAVLQHVKTRGATFIPVPLAAASGATWVSQDDHLWELAPWMPGSADFNALPTKKRLQAALRALARFHKAAEDFPLSTGRLGPPPAIEPRRRRLEELLSGGLDQLADGVDHSSWPELANRAAAWYAVFRRPAVAVLNELQQLAHLEVPLQPCVRDVWHDHVLFTGDEVTGLIDFGAMQVDNIATDIARLLGSLARDDPAAWSSGLAAYEKSRPLNNAQRQLVTTLDRSAVLLGGLNWFDWVYLQRRSFDNREVIIKRLDEGLQRLQYLADHTDASGAL